MDTHSGILLTKCAQFRDEGQFVDVRLKVGKETFPAHRNVLASYSDYFYAMFADGMKESNQEVIDQKDESLSPHVFKVVMDCIYSGDLQINEENVFEVLAAADYLQVRNVLQQCCDFLLTEIIQSARLIYKCIVAFGQLPINTTLGKLRRPQFTRWHLCIQMLVKVKSSCRISTQTNYSAFSVEMTSMRLRRHSSSNL